MITVIVTTYRHHEFIAQTIESILLQTYGNWELLIGDDSPDDDTWDIIQKYTLLYPDKIRARHHSPNKGIINNTNFLLKQISKHSRYVAFLEGDDLYLSDNLNSKLDVFMKYPEVGLVYSDMSFIDGDNAIILPSFFSQRGIQFYQNEIIPIDKYVLSKAGPICSRSTGMFRREVLDAYSINNIAPENKSYSVSDRDIYFQIATKHKVYGIKKVLTQYRRHANNLSASGGGTSSDLELLLSYYYENNFISMALFQKKCSWTKIVSCIFALEHGNLVEAYFYLKESIKHSTFSFFGYKIICIGLIVSPKSLTRAVLSFFIKRG